MKRQVVFVLMFMMACGQDTSTPDVKVAALDATKHPSEVWVCHHPGTNMHGQVCIEEEFPRGCFVAGNTRAFCWELTESDCQSSQDQQWQRENCHLLGM